MEKRLEEFTDERFLTNIKNLVDIGIETDKQTAMFDPLYFVTDLHNFGNRITRKN